jgi:hypothetical protein
MTLAVDVKRARHCSTCDNDWMTVPHSNTCRQAPFRILAGKAADYIREHGWTQHVAEEADGRACLIHAMLQARARMDTKELAYRRLREHFADFALGGSMTSIWNDHPDRTESEVLGVLDAISEGWL